MRAIPPDARQEPPVLQDVTDSGTTLATGTIRAAEPSECRARPRPVPGCSSGHRWLTKWCGHDGSDDSRAPEAMPAPLELGETFSRSFLKLLQGFVTRPWTLVHADHRVDKLLFGDPANDEVVVLDWQTVAGGPGGYDLAYLLGGSLVSRAMMRRHGC